MLRGCKHPFQIKRSLLLHDVSQNIMKDIINFDHNQPISDFGVFCPSERLPSVIQLHGWWQICLYLILFHHLDVIQYSLGLSFVRLYRFAWILWGIVWTTVIPFKDRGVVDLWRVNHLGRKWFCQYGGSERNEIPIISVVGIHYVLVTWFRTVYWDLFYWWQLVLITFSEISILWLRFAKIEGVLMLHFIVGLWLDLFSESLDSLFENFLVLSF